MRAYAFILLILCVVRGASEPVVPDLRLAKPVPLTNLPAGPGVNAGESKPHAEIEQPWRQPEEQDLIPPASIVSSVAPGAGENVADSAAKARADEQTGQKIALAAPSLIDSIAKLDASPGIFVGTAETPSVPALVEKAKKIDEVFVPLREWKEKKLQDIESRVKQGAEGNRQNEQWACDGGQRRASFRNNNILSGNAESALFLSKRQLQFRELFSRTCPTNGIEHGDYRKASNELPRNAIRIPAPVIVQSRPLPTLQGRKGTTDIPERETDDNYTDVSSERIAAPGEVRGEVPSGSPTTDAEEQNNDGSGVTSDKSTRMKVSETGDGRARPTKARSKEFSDLPPEGEMKDVNAPLQRLRNLGKQVGIVRDPSPMPCAATPEQHVSESVPPKGSIHACAGDCEAQIAPSEKPTFMNATTGEKPDSNKNENRRMKSSQKRRERTDKPDSFASESADAGFGKVSKKSFNFASQVAGAQILAASVNAVGAKNIINEDADKYMLVPCAGDGIGGSRWVDIELSEYVILKSVQTANYEHYSSSALKLAVLGAEKYPPKKWNVLGVFDFANDRSVQTFHISGAARRKVSRFLRVVYAGKQGHEYYCPISIFRAFGKNLIADLKDGLEGKQAVSGKADNSLADMQYKSAPQSDVSGDSGAVDMAKEVRATDITGIEAVMKRAAAFVKGEPVKNSGVQLDQKGTPSLAKTKREDGSGRAKVELSSDDQILLNVVREETLSPVSGDDNIFRQVARMIRLLELNQSLTNQYIDTHLSRYAAALASVQREAAKAQEAGAIAQARVASLDAGVEAALQQMRASSFRRDMLLGALVALVGFLLGTHWVMWTALNGARINQSGAEVSAVTASSDFDTRPPRQMATAAQKPRIIETVSVDGVHVQMTDVRRRRKKGRRIGGASFANGEFDSPVNGKSRGRVTGNGNRGNVLASNSFQLLSTDEQNFHRDR